MADVLIPEDTSRSRLDRGRSSSTPGENPDEIGLVDGRVRAFWVKFPNGRIETTVEPFIGTNSSFMVAAHVWKDAATNAPDSTGHSIREYGAGEEPYSAFPLESAETIAIGRALRFLGRFATTGEDTEDA